MKKIALLFIIIMGCTFKEYPCEGFLGSRHHKELLMTQVINNDSFAIFHCVRIDGVGNKICPWKDTVLIQKRKL